jgi:hypothetical protein
MLCATCETNLVVDVDDDDRPMGAPYCPNPACEGPIS